MWGLYEDISPKNGIGGGIGVLAPILETPIEKTMEYEMETGAMSGSIGIGCLPRPLRPAIPSFVQK